MNPKILNSLIQQALKEDIGSYDVTTTLLIPKNHISSAYILCKQDAIFCGMDVAQKLFQKLDKRIQFCSPYQDGAKVKKNTRIIFLRGRTQAILTVERVALNFLSHPSGIATLTDQFVQRVKPCRVEILSTRKTTPRLRILEKYAVRCGGGHNHRENLSEMVLIKDNHLAACRALGLSLSAAIEAVQQKTSKKIEVEVTALNQFREALSANPDIILLDNMTPAAMKKAVDWRNRFSSRKKILLEASGGVTLKNLEKIAHTGVERISIGALTHSSKAINLSLEIE